MRALISIIGFRSDECATAREAAWEDRRLRHCVGLRRHASRRRPRLATATSFSRRVRVRALPTTTKLVASPGKKPREAERREAHPTSVRAAPTRVAACRRFGRGSAPQTSIRSLRNSSASGRARLTALRCGSRRDFHIPAQLQARLPGTRSRWALPALSCPSPVEAPHVPAVVPECMMPKAARERFAKPRAGAAPCSALRIASGMRPSDEQGERDVT